jgi:hypothetical protein
VVGILSEDVGNLKIGVALDTVAFNAGIAALSKKMQIVSQDFKNASGDLDKVGDASKISALKVTELTSKIDLQKQIVKEMAAAYKESSDRLGENSKTTLDYELKLKKAEGSLQNLEKALKSATAEVKDEGQAVNKTGDETTNLDNKTDKLNSTMGKIGGGLKVAAGAVAAMGAAVAAAAIGMGKMVMSAAENADGIQQNADVYGMTAERIQELTYAGTKLDVELDTMLGAQSKLTKSMFAAQSGTKASVDAFDELKVSATDVNGNLRDSKTVMSEAFDALGKMSNETERDALSMKIFGKSAMELNPLIKAGSAELNNLTTEAHKNGAVISNESIAALDKFGDSVDAMKLSFKGLTGNLAIMVLPAFDKLRETVQEISNALGDALKSGDFTQFGKVLSDGINSAVSGLLSGMAKFTPMVTKLLSGLINILVKAIPTVLPALTDGVMQLIQAAVKILNINGPMIIKAGVDAVITLVKGMLEAYPDIMKAGISMLTTLINAISKELPTLIPLAVDTVLTLVQGLIDNLPMLIDSAVKMIMALVTGLSNSLPKIIEKAPEIITSLIVGLAGALPQLLSIGPQIIEAILKGIINSVGTLTFGSQAYDTIKQDLKNQDWGALGWDIINNIGNGMGDFGKSFGNAIKPGLGNQWLADFWNAPAFAVGTNYVPRDMTAIIHEGEAIVPKAYNPAAGGQAMPQGGDMVFNFDMGGGVVKTVRLTSEQIAVQQRTRTGFKAVVV